MRELTHVVWSGPSQCLGYVRSTSLPTHADAELSLQSLPTQRRTAVCVGAFDHHTVLSRFAYWDAARYDVGVFNQYFAF